MARADIWSIPVDNASCNVHQAVVVEHDIILLNYHRLGKFYDLNFFLFSLLEQTMKIKIWIIHLSIEVEP